MELPWIVLTCALALGILSLLLYLLSLRRSIREVAEELEEKLRTDTNTLISISTGDRTLRALTAQIEDQQRRLEELQVEINMQGDISKIQDYARENLHMDYAKKEDTRVVALP